MKRVSINQAFIDAIEETDENIGRYTNQMNKWAKYIERQIGTARSHKIKASKETVSGCSVLAPDDCYSIIGIFLGDYEDQCNIQYRNLMDVSIRTDEYRAGEDVYDRDLTMLWMPLETTWLNPMVWELIGDQINLINEYDNQDITIVYQQIETDDRGYWIVNESHIPAITAYIKYKYASKFQWNVFKSEKMLREGHMAMIRELERQYNIKVRDARAQDMQEDEFERQKR